MTSNAAAEALDAYRAAIDQWHDERIVNLKKPDGWLNLAGLFWLKPGENTFGADAKNDIIFPGANTPAVMGAFILQDSVVTIKALPGVKILHEQQPVTEMRLRSDADGDKTVLSFGSLRWFIIKREDRYAVRLRDLDSPLARNFKGIERYPVDPKWKVAATLKPYNPPKTLNVPTVYGTVVKEACPGALNFTLDGKTYLLEPTQEDDSYFIVFGDATNGKETYGGGRFLYIKPDAGGKLFIDFNKAYNPPCVFTPYATCPMPTPENRLPLRITAGEQIYGDGHH